MQQDRSARRKALNFPGLEGQPKAAEGAAYSPFSNPFAPRPETRTPTGSILALKLAPEAVAADSPAITTSADGAYYDIELSPGIGSNPERTAQLNTEAITNPCYEPDAGSWLSSPDVDLEGIKQSWDSAGIPVEHAKAGSGHPSPTNATSKISSQGTPRTGGKGGSSVKAKAWLLGQAQSPGRAVLPSTEDSEVPLEEQWKIPAAMLEKPAAKPATARSSASSSEGTPKRDLQQALAPLMVPSPAHEYPRSFPLLAEEAAASGVPSATGSFRAWLADAEAELEDTSSKTPGEQCAPEEGPSAESVHAVGESREEVQSGELVQEVQDLGQQAAERKQQEKEEEELAQATPAAAVASSDAAPAAFASPISLAADSPAPVANPLSRLTFQAAASPTTPQAPAAKRHRSLSVSTVLCVLTFAAALVAALLLVPTGFSTVGPAGLGAKSNLAIFPGGSAVPQLGPQLADWAHAKVASLPPALAKRAPAWLLPAKPAPLPQSLSQRLAGWARALVAQLPPQLLADWAPAWLLPTEPAATPASGKRPAPEPSPKPQPTTAEASHPAMQSVAAPKGKPAGPTSLLPGRGRSSLASQVISSIKWPPPLPKSWAKPLPPLNSGTEHLKPPPSELAKLAQAAKLAKLPSPSMNQPQHPAAPVVKPAAEVAASPELAPPLAVLPVPEPPKPSTLPSPPPSFMAQSSAPVAPAMPQLPPAPMETPGAAARLGAALQEQVATLAAHLQRWADASEPLQQVQRALTQLPAPLAGSLAGASPRVLAAIGGASLAAAVLGGMMAVMVGRGMLAAAEAAAGEAAGGERGKDMEELQVDTRPGVKSNYFAHMKVQRPPTTTPAVGGRARRRQSTIGTIEVQPDDEGLPSVAPSKPAPRSSTKPRARKQDAPASGVPAPTPRTATRSVRRAPAIPEELMTDDTGVRRSRRLAL